MAYSSSLTDEEWEILEPLLAEILPQRKVTAPTIWSKRDILDGVFYQLKNGCNWEDLPKDLPPYSTVFYHYNHWRKAGAIERLMNVLHGQVREAVKKKRSGQR
jgi:transposase